LQHRQHRRDEVGRRRRRAAQPERDRAQLGAARTWIAMGVDPKVFFANERTYLHWLNVSVTIGSIGSALLGLSGIATSQSAGEGGFDALRTIGLLMLAIAILFCGHAMYQYRRRGKLLRQHSGTGYDDSNAPAILSFVLIVAMGAIYSSYLLRTTDAVDASSP